MMDKRLSLLSKGSHLKGGRQKGKLGTRRSDAVGLLFKTRCVKVLYLAAVCLFGDPIGAPCLAAVGQSDQRSLTALPGLLVLRDTAAQRACVSPTDFIN